MKTIKSATISNMPRPMPEGMFDPMPVVTVTYTDGSTEKLFAYYPDEISFTPGEFKGLTRKQALTLRLEKHKKYLQQ